MKARTIERLAKAFKVNMGGIILDQALPQRGLDMVDPFLLIHHLDFTYNGGEQQQNVGVPPHPHKGFSPVSFIFKGGIHHRDSIGNDSIVGAGGTQWMHSGRGIIHSERPTKEAAENGGAWELIQFWVNAPKSTKFKEPHYIPLDASNTPTLQLPNDGGTIAVVAGEAHGLKGAIPTESPQLLVRYEVKAGQSIETPIPFGFNALLYVLDGAGTINGQSINAKDMIIFAKDGEGISLNITQDMRAILLSGEPLNEPVESYGPFVMTNKEEIKEAIAEFQSGKMGRLVEKFN